MNDDPHIEYRIRVLKDAVDRATEFWLKPGASASRIVRYLMVQERIIPGLLKQVIERLEAGDARGALESLAQTVRVIGEK